MSYIKSAIYSLILLTILCVSVLLFLLTTTSGLYTTIRLANIFLPGKIEVHQPSGNLIRKFTFSKLSYENEHAAIQLFQGHLSWQLSRTQLTVKELGAEHLIVDLKHSNNPVALHALPFLIQLNQVAIGKVDIKQGILTHHFEDLNLTAFLEKKRWTIKQLSLNYANLHGVLQGHIQPFSPYIMEGELLFKSLNHQKQALSGKITWNGDFSMYQWQGLFKGPVQGKLQGTLKNGLEFFTQASWHDVIWPGDHPQVLQGSKGQLTLQGHLPDLKIDAQTHFSDPLATDWQLTGQIKKKQAVFKSTLNLPHGNKVTADASIRSATEAQLNLTIHPGTYHLPEGSAMPAIAFQGGKLSIRITPQLLQATGILTLDQHKVINLAVKIPKFRLDQPISNLQVDGKLNMQVSSLDFIEALNPAFEELKGQLQLNLTAKGALMKPTITGEVLLTDASFSLPKLGITLNPIKAQLQSSNNHWKAQGLVEAEGKTLTLQGEGDFSPTWEGRLEIVSNEFPAMKTAEYTINIAPKLLLQFKPSTIELSGDVLVPSAKLKPISFSNTESLSEDVVFLSQKEAPNPFNLTTNIRLIMGEDVALDVKGLHGFLDGAIQVTQTPGHALTGLGELKVRDGRYHAYGQDLTIESGGLMFTGGPIDNPGINLRAVRKFVNSTSTFAGSNQLLDFNPANLDTVDFGNKTTVGIELSGRLTSHKIKLFSIPPTLSQADILSMLILGKPANQASKSGGQLLLAAISSMNLDSGTKGIQLLSQLKQSIGIDFDLQSNSQYNRQTNQVNDSTAVVVGKSLTKRVYISYNIGLLQEDSNVLTLKYLLNKFFSIQVNASDTGTGIDLLYTHSKD